MTNDASRSLRHEEAGLSDLRHDSLVLLKAALLGASLALLVATAFYIDRLGNTPLYAALALSVLVVAVHLVGRFGVQLAAAVLVIGLVGVVAGCVRLSANEALVVAIAVPVLIANALLGTFAGFGTMLLGGGVVMAAALQQPGADSTEVLVLSLGAGTLVLVCSIALWHSFYTVLDWSWASYEEAQQRAAELRERQVELGRLNQSLVLAYEQIRQTSAQLERARQAAEEARRLKSEFAASVSHELRTPLNLIIGLSELMVVTPHVGAPTLPDVYRADVEAIYRNACHISNLIDDVLDLSQIEAHRMGLLKEWVSLDEVVSQATATVRTLFENTGLTLDVRIPDDFPLVFADPVRIRQILINLLNNAVRFTEEGGVTIQARVEGEQAVLDVTDTGVGIPTGDLPGVFQEFWHSGEPKRGRRGSGLGLAVSKRFAELHGGNLWVTSTPGQGSTFSLALPLGEKALVNETDLTRAFWQRLEQQTPASQTVVVIDPEPDALRAIKRHLDGYHVAVAEDATSVARLVEQAPVQAIIVDTAKRRDIVRRALQHVGPARSGARVPIVTTALRTSKTIAQELGVLDYLVKPVTQQQVQRALRRFGRGPRELVLVDDDPEMLHLLTRMIGALTPRCHVRTASDGWQALDLLESRVPNGLLLDLLMPGLDGYGVLAHMKRDPRLARVPVVVISARAGEDDGLVADVVEVSQPGGLHVGEVCRWIRAGIDLRRQRSDIAGATGRRAEPAA